jgi:hypothetical protein
MHKAQNMSHQNKLPSIPISVARVFEPREYSNMSTVEVRGEWHFKAHNRRAGHPFQTDIDASVIRDGFLSIRNEDDALQFFRRTGYFYSLHDGKLAGEDGVWKHGPHVFASISDIQRCQKLIKETAITPIPEWQTIAKAYPSHWFKPFEAAPIVRLLHSCSSGALGKIACGSGLSAIAALIQVNHLAGLEWRACARGDCAGLFRVESRHSRKFCSIDCAHLVAVRLSRARLRGKSSKVARSAY